MKIFIIGFMASGKTTMGKLLAEALKMKFYDIDHMIESYMQITINEIFLKYGEIYFRELETKILSDLTEEAVYSCGGGIIESQTNRNLIREKADLVLWLNPDWKIITQRLNPAIRPLVKNNTTSQLHDLYNHRLPLYKEIADIEYQKKEITELLKVIKEMPGF